MALGDIINYLESNNINCMIEGPNGEPQRATLTASAPTACLTSVEKEILTGTAFSIEYVVDVGAGDSSYDIVIDPRLVDDQFWSLPTKWNSTDGPLVITLGVCDSYTGGTALAPTQRNSNFASNVAKTVFKYDATVTNFVAAPTKILVGQDSTNQTAGGGVNAGANPINLDKTKIYVFRVDNQAGTPSPEAIQLGFSVEIFETKTGAPS